MANKVLLVAKSRIEANRLAPDYGISRFTYVFGAAGVRRLAPSDTVWLLPGWEGNPAKFAIENALRYTRATVKRPAPVDAPPVGEFHCAGCGEDYDTEYELDIHECPGAPDQVEIYSGQSPDPVRTYQEPPAAPTPFVEATQEDFDAAGIEAMVGDFSTLATNDTGEPERIVTPDDWGSIVTTDKHDVEPEETSAETAAPEPSQDPEEAPAEVEPKVKRRRRRCKVEGCGQLIEPDDVEAHAATHVEA